MAGAGEEVQADEGPAAAPEEDSYLVGKSATAAGRRAAEGTAAAAAAECAEASDPDPEITARLSTGFVVWILNRKWVSFDEEDPDDHYDRMINDPDRPEEYTQEYLEEERDTMRELVAHNKRSRARFEKFQEWVRRQLDEKGYVEVGEDYIAQSIINRQSVTPELWSALMGGLMG